jgi:hypothetical protein
MRAEKAKDPDERKPGLFDRKHAPARNVILQSFLTRISRGRPCAHHLVNGLLDQPFCF